SMSSVQSSTASASQAMAPWLTKPFGSSKLAAAIRSNASSRAGVVSLISSSSLPPTNPLPPSVRRFPARQPPPRRIDPPSRLGRLASAPAHTSSPPFLSRADRSLEVREQGLPAGPVPLAPLIGRPAQTFPAAMLDLDPGPSGVLGDE